VKGRGRQSNVIKEKLKIKSVEGINNPNMLISSFRETAGGGGGNPPAASVGMKR
jgi:hypothetical protein